MPDAAWGTAWAWLVDLIGHGRHPSLVLPDGSGTGIRVGGMPWLSRWRVSSAALVSEPAAEPFAIRQAP